MRDTRREFGTLSFSASYRLFFSPSSSSFHPAANIFPCLFLKIKARDEEKREGRIELKKGRNKKSFILFVGKGKTIVSEDLIRILFSSCSVLVADDWPMPAAPAPVSLPQMEMQFEVKEENCCCSACSAPFSRVQERGKETDGSAPVSLCDCLASPFPRFCSMNTQRDSIATARMLHAACGQRGFRGQQFRHTKWKDKHATK